MYRCEQCGVACAGMDRWIGVVPRPFNALTRLCTRSRSAKENHRRNFNTPGIIFLTIKLLNLGHNLSNLVIV